MQDLDLPNYCRVSFHILAQSKEDLRLRMEHANPGCSDVEVCNQSGFSQVRQREGINHHLTQIGMHNLDFSITVVGALTFWRPQYVSSQIPSGLAVSSRGQNLSGASAGHILPVDKMKPLERVQQVILLLLGLKPEAASNTY